MANDAGTDGGTARPQRPPDPDAGSHTWVIPGGSDPDHYAVVEHDRGTRSLSGQVDIERTRNGAKVKGTKKARVRNKAGSGRKVSYYEQTVTLEEWNAQNEMPRAPTGRKAAADPLAAPPGGRWEKDEEVVAVWDRHEGWDGIGRHVLRSGTWTLRFDGYDESSGEEETRRVEPADLPRKPWCIECGSRPARSLKSLKCDACRKRKERS